MYSTTFRPLFDHGKFIRKKIELKSSTKYQSGAPKEEVQQLLFYFKLYFSIK